MGPDDFARSSRVAARLLLLARLRRASVDLAKTLEGFDFSFNARINRQQLLDLATCGLVEKH